jgi:UDP-N-acetyl-D-mannosaminuronic acid dehydrogenase
MRLIPLARQINDGIPVHMLSLIEQTLQEKDLQLEGAKVTLLDVSYLENADDTRNTPSAVLANLLLVRGVQVVVHDPYVRMADWQRTMGNSHNVPLLTDLSEALKGSDCAAIVTRHTQYFDLTPEMLHSTMRTRVMVDGRNVLGSQAMNGIVLRTLGRGESH